jgi:hypothetical protein
MPMLARSLSPVGGRYLPHTLQVWTCTLPMLVPPGDCVVCVSSKVRRSPDGGGITRIAAAIGRLVGADRRRNDSRSTVSQAAGGGRRVGADRRRSRNGHAKRGSVILGNGQVSHRPHRADGPVSEAGSESRGWWRRQRSPDRLRSTTGTGPASWAGSRSHDHARRWSDGGPRASRRLRSRARDVRCRDSTLSPQGGCRLWSFGWCGDAVGLDDVPVAAVEEDVVALHLMLGLVRVVVERMAGVGDLDGAVGPVGGGEQ